MFDKILEKIEPSEDERKKIKLIADYILNGIKIKDAKIEFGGSYAKNTWISGNYDIDIYVKFNFNKFKDKDIGKLLYNYLKKKFKVSILHGSRDYYRIKKGSCIFEIIPILDIKDAKQARNITDISPLHVKYVKEHYNKEIRLSKAFCKAYNVYGAESHIGGFSGYALEVLTIKEKGFINLLKKASKWKDKEYIGSKDLINKLNKSKKVSPLILIDPVDEDRNVTAALTKEKYDIFVKKAKEFLNKPSEKFFVEEKFDINKLRKKNLVILKVEPLKIKEDVAAAKMFKAFNYIKRHLEINEFKVKESGWNFENKIFWFSFDKLKLSDKVKHYGPSIKFEDRFENFKGTWKGYKIYKDKSIVYVIINRKYNDVKSFFRDFLKDKSLLNLVKSIRY